MTIVKSEDTTLIGAKVLKIGDVAIADIFARLPEFVPHDNPHTILWISPMFLRLPLFLHYVGATDSLDSATFTLALPDGTEQTVTLSANGKEFSFDDFAKLEAVNENAALFAT